MTKLRHMCVALTKNSIGGSLIRFEKYANRKISFDRNNVELYL